MPDARSNFGFFDAQRLRSWQRNPPAPDEAPLPPRFSLLALLAISTAAAIYCGLLRLLGVYAVMLMLAALVGLYFVRVSGPWRAAKRLTIDMLAGIVLPIGCLVFDPGVFRASDSINFPMQICVYTLLGSEMLLLFVWLLVGTAFNRFGRDMTAGVFFIGCVICIGLGLFLTLAGLGLILFGFVGFGGAWPRAVVHARNILAEHAAGGEGILWRTDARC